MAQNYGTTTANLMDAPLSLKSVFAPYVGDNGYKWTVQKQAPALLLSVS
jgi:hypothetical protein